MLALLRAAPLLAASVCMPACQPPYSPAGHEHPPPRFEAAQGRRGLGEFLSLLEGASIVAEDGQFLGTITANEFAQDSILNEFGRYGSEFSRTSIFNEFCPYGGEFSRLSPFNEFTSTPPRLLSPAGDFLGYLTTSEFEPNGIDPYVLIALLKLSR